MNPSSVCRWTSRIVPFRSDHSSGQTFLSWTSGSGSDSGSTSSALVTIGDVIGEYPDQLANEFIIRDLIDSHPELIEPMLKLTIATFFDFQPSRALILTARPYISAKVSTQLDIIQDRTTSDMMKLFEIMENFTTDMMDHFVFEVRKNFMIRPSTDQISEYIILPDLASILLSWEERYQTDQERSLESTLILERFPTFFVELHKKADGSLENSLFGRVWNYVQDSIAIEEVRRILAKFVKRRVLSRTPTVLTRSLFNFKNFDQSFLVVCAFVKLPPEMFELLLERFKGKVSEDALQSLEYINTMGDIYY